MSFSTDIAELVANQLSRFVTLNRHQLAGQAANLDFWLGEVQHALAVIDGYGVRFTRMHAAQEQHHAMVAHDLATHDFVEMLLESRDLAAQLFRPREV